MPAITSHHRGGHIYMPSMKCINKEICLLAIVISSAFITLKTTLLTALNMNSSYEP